MSNIDWGFFSGVHHFYSPIPSLDAIKHYDEIAVRYDNVFDIDLNNDKQKENLLKFAKYYQEIPWRELHIKDLRYHFENMYYSYTDAIVLYSFMRMLQPKHIIEMGSGYSSAVMLDCNQLFFNNTIEFTFIEPYPDRLYSLLSIEDKKITKIYDHSILDVDISEFKTLQSGDILFIDSSHCSKFGSDVNDIIFRVLPQLNRGVYIHFHDIFFPFEQPKSWLEEGRYWNETYLLKAFLMNNNDFSIEFMNHYMWKFFADYMRSTLPIGEKNVGGSLWIRKN